MNINGHMYSPMKQHCTWTNFLGSQASKEVRTGPEWWGRGRRWKRGNGSEWRFDKKRKAARKGKKAEYGKWVGWEGTKTDREGDLACSSRVGRRTAVYQYTVGDTPSLGTHTPLSQQLDHFLDFEIYCDDNNSINPFLSTSFWLRETEAEKTMSHRRTQGKW